MQSAYDAARAGRLEEAANHCLAILQTNPNSAEALHLLGMALSKRGDTEKGIGFISQALELAPDWPDALSNLGNALMGAGRLEEALVPLQRAISLAPFHESALYNLGTALQEIGQAHAAIAIFDRLLELFPENSGGWCNRGNALSQLHRFSEAEACYARSMELDPGHALVVDNRAAAILSQGRTAEALAMFDAALKLEPDRIATRWNRSNALLKLGDFAQGWQEFEWRFAMGMKIPDGLGTRWTGEQPIAGKILVVHAEQGLGDTLHFARYAAILAARGARVVLHVPASLARLLRRINGLHAVITQDDPIPPHDLHIPMMSVPLALGTDADSIPADIPYLHADPASSAIWAERLAAVPGLRVGIVWSGNARPDQLAAHITDQRRSMRLADMRDLAGPGISLISLQKGPPATQAHPPPDGITLIDWTDELHDFADTADLVAGLDAVVCVDTSVAHLAGGLGIPTLLLSRLDGCWRWLDHGERTAWYPSMRIYRQVEPFDWSAPMAEAVAELSWRVGS